eukprot:242253_1
MSLKALDIYWSKTKSFAKSNWKYAASFALGSLISFATSYSFIKYLTGYNVREMIFGVLWRLKLAKYRNELEYKDFSYKPKIRPSSECMAIDEFFRSAPKGDPTATRDVFLDINSKYYYLKSRNNFNKLYMKHKLPTYMDTPKKITINNNWNNTNFELNGYLYTYPGCSIENGLLLYIHGGGFFLGTYMQIDSWITILMQKLGICVLSLDYQLCPEVNGIPNQVNQCIDSYKYILNKMGVDNKKIFIGGASAGGALSLLTIQKINELNLNEPCGGVIISLCADISAEIVKETAEKYNINDAMLGKAWSAEFASAFYINDDDKKNKLSINLTAERILKIFVNLAEVKLAYDKNVPFNFTEKEFWKSFLQSHYFKRETTRNVTSGISDKETQMDKLLKKYLIELKRNKINKRNEIHTASSSGNNKYRINNDNSFAKQLQKIQLKRNLEVDAQGAKKRMTDDIAQARAIKDGKNILIKQIESGDINVNDKGECMDIIVKVKQQCNGDINGDIDMKNMKNNNQHKQEKQVNYRRKLNIEDASVDLSLTQDSFIELIQDPGIDDGKNMRRDDIQHWFSQVNKHGMMLLYQSINQNNKYKDKKNMEELMINVPKVNYGSKYKMEINEYENEEDLDNDICVEMGDNGLDMNYLDRLKRITEFEDLKLENSKNFIELKIKDQSVYWGDNLLLDDQQLTRNNQVAKQLNAYLGQVQDKKKKLAESDVVNLIQPKYCNMI